MDIVESLLRIVAGYCLLMLLGFGLTSSSLSRTPHREYAIFLAPAAGYAALCFFSVWFSGLSGAPAVQTTLWAAAGLSMWTMWAAFRQKERLPAAIQQGKTLIILLIPMILLGFFPLLVQGVDLYLGTVNPDFEDSLGFHEGLVQFHANFWVLQKDLPLQGPFEQHFFPRDFQARFGGVTYSILLEQVFGGTSRAAIMNAIADFLLCVPAAMYAFCRIVFEFDRRSAIAASIVVAVAAPTTMSLIHSFVGQNSALAMFPLALTLLYIAFKESSLTVAAFAAIVLNGILWLYSVILPYLVAPVALFIGVMTLRERGRNIRVWLLPVAAFVFASIAIHLSVFSTTSKFVQDLSRLLGNVKFAPLYTDFLSEDVFEYATGLTTYPVVRSLLFSEVREIASPLLIALGMLIAATYVVAVRTWMRVASRPAVIFILSLLATYTAVWIKYTFLTRYGYAPFKMAQWLQFISAPPLCWYLLQVWDKREAKGGIFKISVGGPVLLLGPIYIGLNLISTIDYGLLCTTSGRPRSALINSYGIGGNVDFPDLALAMRKVVPEGSTVAVGFSDMIENFWATYYLTKAKLNATLLSHELLPIEDAYLPDVTSRIYTDFVGDRYVDRQRYFNNGIADYYLLSGPSNLNTEILDVTLGGAPVWQNGTFRLFRHDAVSDLFVTGRGFYRVEHDTASHPGWWWPDTFRWVAQGGELYQINPARPSTGYRLAFDVITGLGVTSGRRTLELWHNNEKFDEIVVNGVGRVVSKPYVPVTGVNRLVIRAKEVPALTARRLALWNKDLPERAAPLNFLLSNISVSPEDSTERSNIIVGQQIESASLFEKATSYDGINIDGWVGDRGRFCIRTPDAVTKISINVLIPGNLGFVFPFRVDSAVDGIKSLATFAAPGEQTLEFTLPAKAGGSCHEIEIAPERSVHIADGMKQREVIQSIRLNRLKFQ